MKTIQGTLIASSAVLLAALMSGSSLQQTVMAQAPSPSATPASPRGTTEGAGSTIFGNYCESCHGNPKVDSAPAPAMLKKMTPEHIYMALTQGDMVQMAKNLSDQQKRDIAEWVGGRKLQAANSGDASKMSNPCPANPPIQDITSTPSWNGWSPGLTQSRYSPAHESKMPAGNISKLHLKWAFGLPSADSVYGQPTVVAGRVFLTSDAGYVYSLDAKTGCVHWSYPAGVGIRSAITIGPTKPGSKQFAAFFGDVRGNVYSVDASTGKLLWKIAIDEQQLSRITGGTILYNGRLFVPVASLEEPESSSPNYACCQFRGMIAALDTATGKEVWKTYTIPEKATQRKTPDGKTFFGPSGVGVWGPITIDPKRNALYIGTGNTFSDPDVGRSDAVMAMSLDAGKVLWVKQNEPEDVWHTGCPQGPAPPGFPAKPARRPPVPGHDAPVRAHQPPMPASYYCPNPEGPDLDFSSGAMLGTLPGGHGIIVAGQKSGMVWAHDPDKDGALMWKSRDDLPRGQIVFGGAMDDQNAYFAFRSGGVAAMKLTDGKEKWYTPVEAQEKMSTHAGFSAAISVIPGAVFAAGLDGVVHAFDTNTGKELWKYDTTPEVKTVNGVAAHGGSIGSAGPTVADGMLYVTSGYTGFQNGAPGNLLLAFTE